MPNLRTILEELVKNIQDGDLTVYEKEMIEDAEREIKELILEENELVQTLHQGIYNKKISEKTPVRNLEIYSLAKTIHSAILKKLEG